MAIGEVRSADEYMPAIAAESSCGWRRAKAAPARSRELARLALPESSCRILLGELNSAFKLDERLASPVDTMQQAG
jgi:hypothetical protein